MNKDQKLLLSMTASPHIKSPIKTKNLMADVLLALMPMLVWAIYIFGLRALTITLISVLSCVIFELVYRKLAKKSCSIGDLSAVVTGVLLAYSLPVSVPLWLPVVGSFFAIVIVKQLYGGIGKNIVNPALAARVFLFIAYPTELTSFTYTGIEKLNAFKIDVSETAEIIKAGATPLVSLKSGTVPETSALSTLIGNHAGCIGEVSALLIILTGLFLILRGVITWHIPVSYIATVAVLSYIFPVSMPSLEFTMFQLFSGGLMIGAFFMATDYVTSPVTKSGRVIYGIGCGLITIFIRYFGGYPEGVSFAILIMNLFVWYIDKATKPKAFGGGK